MGKELLARGQATITSQTDAYTLTQSVGEYVFPAASDGRITATASVITRIEVTQGDQSFSSYTIGNITKPVGFSSVLVDNTVKSVTFNVAAGATTLADHGTVDIPVIIAGVTYHLSFVWSKAKAGAPGVAGTDANLLDWVKEWNTGRTQIDANTVITPKLFAGVKNADGTLTGTALGRYTVSVKTASGTLSTETVDGISGFKDGYKTFFLDNGGNAQLGRGDQFIKYNAATGKVEFGAAVSLLWAGATYIDKNGIFTGTLSATTVSTVHLDASQITSGKIAAQYIDVASLKTSLITAGNIEALTLNVVRGKVGGWSLDGDSIFRGVKNNTAGAFTASPGAVTLGSNGLRGYKWTLEATGAGALAGGNISWDAAGNVVFAPTVSLLWSGPIGSVTAALGGASYTKLTKISADGIYTGSLTASQVTAGTLSADRIAAGSLKAEKLDAASIRASIINTDYINGLNCTFVRGKIGGWTIGADNITAGSVGAVGAMPIQIRSAATGSGYWYSGAYRPLGIVLTWHQVSNAGHIVLGQVAASGSTVKTGFIGLQMMSWDNKEYFCLSANTQRSGSKEVCNRIAGWAFDYENIWKDNVSLGADGSITNGTKWQFKNDGSGQIANGNISWNAAGTVTFASSVSLNWTTPINNITTALGGATYSKLTKITAEGIYTGNLTAQQITAGTLSTDRLDAASIKSKIINAGYISGLNCAFTQGKIGGWTIGASMITSGRIVLDSVGKRIAVYADNASPTTGCRVQLYYNNDNDFGFLTTNSSGTLVAKFGNYCQIAGWNLDTSVIYKNKVFLGEDGSLYNGKKWRLNNDGSGRIASGNISWDVSGNISFSQSVSVAWTAGINSITTALGGAAYPKLTQISATGIYTGTISAGQISVDKALVVGGSTYNGSISVRDASDNVKVTLDRSGITAVGGRIGGWDITATSIYAASPASGHRVNLASSGYIYNDNPSTGKDHWGLKSDGSATFGYGTISFAKDGSGYLANQNIKWDILGNVELKGVITATGGKIAGFTISGNTLLNNAANSSIEFSSLLGQASLTINGNATGALMSLRADSKRTGIFIQTYAPGAKGLSIIANCGSDYAIESYGPVIMGQRSTEIWNVPGVLYIGSKYTEGYSSNHRKIWGDGVKVSSFTHIGSGQYKVVHNLRHTNYTVFAQQWSSTRYHGFYRLIEKTTTYFVLQNVGTEGKADGATFDYIIFGQNSF